MSEYELERRLVRWLADGPHDAPAEVVTRALVEARAQPQARVISLPLPSLPPLALPRPQALATVLSLALVIVAVGVTWILQGQLVAPGESPSPAPSPSLTASPVPTPTSAPTPTFRPTLEPQATPTPSPDPSGWPERTPAVVGQLDGVIRGVLNLESGHMAYGEVQDEEGAAWSTAWFSPDGQSWESVRLAQPGVACPGERPTQDSFVMAGATNGREAVLVGYERTAEPPCGGQHSVAWFTPDGRTWTRSDPIGEKNDTYLDQVWWVDGGWEALTTGGVDRPTILWRSEDGLEWHAAATIFPAVVGDRPLASRGDFTADGRRVLAIEEPGFLSALLTSDDGAIWRRIESFSGASNSHGVYAVIATPETAPGRWLVVQDSAEGWHAWSSADLANWRHAVVPTRNIVAAIATTGGFALAGDGAIWTSDDGLEWHSAISFPDTGRVTSMIEVAPDLLLVANARPTPSRVWTEMYLLPLPR